LTVREAAAGRNTLLAVTVAVLAGAVILFPALALLFRLVLGGNLGRGESADGRPTQSGSLRAALAPGLLMRLAIACLVVGIGFTTIADAAWAHAIGVFSLLAFIAVAFPAALPPLQK
jgi:cytochrome bd ubiquinol oxidase subunit II